MIEKMQRWALLWHQKNQLDGVTQHLIYADCLPVLFRTRREARAFAEMKYGFIKTRQDLRVEPHGWRFPKPVYVNVVMAPVSRGRWA